MGNQVSCDPCSRREDILYESANKIKKGLDNSQNDTYEAGYKDSRRRLLESHMSNMNNRKRPTLKQRRQTVRGDDEISQSHLENQRYKWDQEELDRDIENDENM
jgi:hypothetical protein